MFQSFINNQPAPAVEGDFADANVRATVLAGAGAMVAAPLFRAPVVGRFAWANQVTGQAFSRYYGETVAKIGFVHRENQAVITPWLDESVMAIAEGLPVTLFNQGSFWAKFTDAAVVGQKVFARYLDGTVYGAAAGTPTQTASLMTGSIVGATGVMTISGITGTLAAGDVLSGGLIAEPVAVIAQLSGTIGGNGTYQTTATQDVANLTSVVANSAVETDFAVQSAAPIDASFTASLAASGILTVSAVGAGALDIGQRVTGAGVPNGTRIIGFDTGSGNTGDYLVNVSGLVLTSRAMVGSSGHLAKISTWS